MSKISNLFYALTLSAITVVLPNVSKSQSIGPLFYQEKDFPDTTITVDAANTPFVTFHQTGVDIHHSSGQYSLETNKSLTASLWHSNAWKYGDLFTFIDVYNNIDEETNWYGEFSPRFSLSKITGSNINLGPVSDFLIATTIEKPEGFDPRILIGGGTDLAIKGMDFAQFNIYLRDDLGIQGTTFQLTVAGQKSKDIGALSFVFSFFADFAGPEGPQNQALEPSSAASLVYQPQLLVDVGKYFNMIGKGHFFLGSEFEGRWQAFGVKGEHNAIPQLSLFLRYP